MATTDIRGQSVSLIDAIAATTPNADLAIKTAVRVATTGNITLSGLQTIDGVAVVANDRVLVWQQTNAANNGIYLVSTGTWTRTSDANNNSQFTKGLHVAATDGTLYSQAEFLLTAANPIKLGTSLLSWVLFSTPFVGRLPTGGTAGNALIKTSSSDYAASWKSPGIINITHPPYNAVGDGATDNMATIQQAINDLQSQFGGGIIYFPPASNTYLISNTLTNSTGTILFLGGGVASTAIMIRTDNPVFNISGVFSEIRNMYIIGKGANNDPGVFGATQPAVVMNGVSSKLDHCQVQGGANCVSCTTDDVYLSDVVASGAYADALINVAGVVFMHRCKLDHNYPVSVPSSPLAFNAWAGTTPYVPGNIVSTGGYYIQCQTGGTSGGSAPTLKNYGVNISDGAGTLVWQLVARTDLNGIKVTVNEFHGSLTDISGATKYGIRVAGGTLTFIDKFIIGNNFAGSILADTGHNLYVSHCELGSGLNTNVNIAAVALSSGWNEDAAITDCTIFGQIGFSSIGVDIEGGENTRIAGNFFKNCDTGVEVRANQNVFIVSENCFEGCTAAVNIEGGTSNRYNVVNNLLGGGALNDGGSGVNKTLTGNN